MTTLNIRPTGTSDPATVRSAARLPNGDVKLHTACRAEARCILKHCQEWSNLADKGFITSATVFLVVLHFVPQHTCASKHSLRSWQPKQSINRCWLGSPVTKQNIHRSMIINLEDSDLASEKAREDLFLDNIFSVGQTDKCSPLQCLRCLGAGQVAARCSHTVPPKCLNCSCEQDL